jgi:hypothetical protein
MRNGRSHFCLLVVPLFIRLRGSTYEATICFRLRQAVPSSA